MKSVVVTTLLLLLCVSADLSSTVMSFQVGTALFHPSMKRREAWMMLSASISSRRNNGDRNGPGMEDSFRQLEQLQSLDGNEHSAITGENDTAFTEAIKGLVLKGMMEDASSSSSTPESEIEMSPKSTKLPVSASDDELIADMKSDLDWNDILVESTVDAKNEAFMNKAIDEALQEAKEQNADVKVEKESLLDNKEIMAEIEKIFDRANDQLFEELDEIRSEQMKLAKESVERNVRASQAKIEEVERRLAVAKTSMQKMLTKVNQETHNVQVAIEDLKRAQEQSEGSLDGQLSGLKSGGILKQATLAGTILFTLRAGVDTIGFAGGDPTHALPALVQGALAVICIIGFMVL